MKPAFTTSLLLVSIALLLNGCASSGPPLPPSLELPAPVSDLRAQRKGDRIYLAWTIPERTTDHETIRHLGPTLICRSTGALTECGAAVGEVAPTPAEKIRAKNSKPAMKIAASYVDHLPASLAGAGLSGEVTYAIEVLNTDRRGAGLSNTVREPAAPALAPPEKFRAEIAADGVRLSWSCLSTAGAATENVQYRLRIYRRLSGAHEDIRVAEPDLQSCAEVAQDQTYRDETFEWEKTYEYRAAAVLVISGTGKPDIEIEGGDTPSVAVFAHDIFPPAVPAGLQAVFSGVGQEAFVDLIWSPDTEADLVGYNIYRHEEGGKPERLNSEAVKSPAYRDTAVRSGHKYFYSVTAVDGRGNESAPSEEASEVVP